MHLYNQCIRCNKRLSLFDCLCRGLRRLLCPVCNCKPCRPPVTPPVPECFEPRVLGWMRSSELFGFVPGARIPVVPPEDGVFRGWNYPWARGNTVIQHFQNEEMLEAALSGEYTEAALGIPETLFAEEGWTIGEDLVWDGGTPNQFFNGYYPYPVPGGWASWQNVEIANDYLFSPETRINTPGVYLPFHYSLRRFTAYADLDLSCYSINSAFLISDFQSPTPNEFIFPLNDSIFVFVNGQMAYWASNDIIGSGNVAQNRAIFYDMAGNMLDRDSEFLFTDGWYLTLGGNQNVADISPYLRNGKNVIDVIADDYYEGGGMSRIGVLFNYTLRT